jgi:hypothetical protein
MFFRLESLFDKSFHGSCLLLSPFNNENACRDSTATEFLPLPCILHSRRSERFAVKIPKVVREMRPPVSCTGCSAMSTPRAFHHRAKVI